MEGVQEEVADSEPQEARVADDDIVDIGYKEFLDILEEKPLTATGGPTMPERGPDLPLASPSGFSLQVGESPTKYINGKERERSLYHDRVGFQFGTRQTDLGYEGLFLHTSSTQESPLPGSFSQIMARNNIMWPRLSTCQAPQPATLADRQVFLSSSNFHQNEDFRHTGRSALHDGTEARENPARSLLRLSILDNDSEELSSDNMAFRDMSRSRGNELSLQPYQNIDRDRPSQTSGSVLASEVQSRGSIDTVDTARMARTPSTGIVVQKQIMTNREVVDLTDSDSDNDDLKLLPDLQQSGRHVKRRAQDIMAMNDQKRPNIHGGISLLTGSNMYDYKSDVSRISTLVRVEDWQKGQLSFDEETRTKSWSLYSDQVSRQQNSSNALEMPLCDGSGLFLDCSRSLVGGGSIQNSRSFVETVADRESAADDLNAKKISQLFQIVSTTAESIIGDTLAGNNKDEYDPPEGQLSVPLLKHQRVALAWMRKRELHGNVPGGGILQGGILADDQGLGKTISTISLVLTERAPIQMVTMGTLHVDVLDDDDNPKVTGRAPTVFPSVSEKHGSNLPVKFGTSVTESNIQNAQVDVLTVSGKFRPAAGTLVVCPTSVLRQWAHEIKEKVTEKAGLSVLIYHGSNRTRNPEELVKYDVVLTTYSIVSMEVPKQPMPEEKNIGKKTWSGGDSDITPPFRVTEKIKKNKEELESRKKHRGNGKGRLVGGENASFNSGPLARVNWFRVVLDEAQSIKNARTQGARAAWGLRSKRRWCLSGTPIQNAIDDLYSYFRFLRYSPFDSYKKFRELVKDPVTRTPMQGYANLLRLLTPVMLRRTKATKINGQPIVKLPERIVNLRQAEFSDEERAFYNDLEYESQKQFQDYAAAGTLQSNYVNILWMLLRLRQACDHPLLVKGHPYQSTQKVILESIMKLSVEKRKHLVSLLEGNRDICPICSDLPDQAVVCVCTHIFCRQCIWEQLATGDDCCCPVPKCRKSLNTSMVFTLASLNNSESGERSGSLFVEASVRNDCYSTEWKSSSKIDAVIETLNALPRVSEIDVKGKIVVKTSKDLEVLKPEHLSVNRTITVERPGKAYYDVDLVVKDEAVSLVELEATVASKERMLGNSAVKVEKFVLGQEDILRRSGALTEDSISKEIRHQEIVLKDITRRKILLTEKAIVFSQWTSMLDLLEAKLKEANFNYRRLDGTMSVLARDRAVSEFKTLPEVNVIIMSLKAASLGLNMVSASHVLLLDVWWNPTTEDQAIDRAHRIGQTRPVIVSRFTVKNTIEDRILALQEKKRRMVASAFGESEGGGEWSSLLS